MRETTDGEVPRNLQWWELITLFRAQWTGEGGQTCGGPGTAGTGQGEMPRWKDRPTARREALKQRKRPWKYPDPSFLSSDLLPGPPLAKPKGKAVGDPVCRDQHPRAEQSGKDGEWMHGTNQRYRQLHFFDTSLRNSCTFGLRCAQKDLQAMFPSIPSLLVKR